jgi:hypothetical protein
MGQSILQIILKVTKEGTGDRDAAIAARELKGSLNDLGLGAFANVTPLAAVAAAVGAITAVTVDATKETVKYADEVRGMMQLTGQSAEESSRLLQVMDDLKVGTDVLKMATKTLSKEGLSMNIDTLGKLSDEYKSLGSAAEKTAFLVKNFGKSGLGMAEAMEQGGNALRSMNDAVEGSLVLTEKQVEAARQLQREQDRLTDSWKAFQMTIGTAVIPVLNDAIKAQLDWQEALTEARKTTGLSSYALEALATEIYRGKQALDAHTASVTASTMGMWDARTSALGLAAAEEDVTAAAKELSDGFKNQLSVIASMQSAEDSYAEKAKSNAEERIQIEKDKADYIAQYGSWNVAKIAEFDGALAKNSQAARDNAAEHEMASRKIILGMLEQQLSMDGLTQGEFAALLEQGKAWGIYSQAVVDESLRAQQTVKDLAAAIDGAPTSKDISINVHFTGDAAGDFVVKNFTNSQGHATGTDGWETVPPGYPNDTYPITLTSGERFAVIPAGASMSEAGGGAGPGGGMSLTANVYTVLNSADQNQIINALYPAFISMVQRAKSDGALR